jgi:hypothetical protein
MVRQQVLLLLLLLLLLPSSGAYSLGCAAPFARPTQHQLVLANLLPLASVQLLALIALGGLACDAWGMQRMSNSGRRII